jgi:hypothetical protein
MEAYYTASIEPWGDVWDPAKTADWIYKQGVLAPLVLGMDYYGYDIANNGKLPKGWAERTRRSAKMQLEQTKPRYAASAGIGYGQGYVAEAALLTDEMADAGRAIDWMAKICFTPRLAHPYRVPEGSIISEDGAMWRRWGDLGNLYQLNEVVYTTHLMVGIDDPDPARLKLMPRMPRDWRGIEVKDWPVRTLSGGVSTMVHLDYKLTRGKDEGLEISINTDRPVDALAVRLGPFPANVQSVRVERNGTTETMTTIQYGDSRWVWVEGKKDSGGNQTMKVRSIEP